MIRGTTPTHIFTLPFDVSLIKEINISYAQQGSIVLQKTLADCSAEGQRVSLHLTQEDTLKFRCGVSVQIQMRVLTKDGEALASDIKTESVERVLCEEVLE